jgi:acetyl-CoA acyltransferase
MNRVMIAGVGMTPFGKSPGRGIRDLARTASAEALADAGVDAAAVQKVFFGNAVAGVVSHQEMIRSEVAFRDDELAGTPMINVENACASGSSALQLGWEAVGGGRTECVLVVGAEQLTHEDKNRTFAALRGSTDIEEIGPPERDHRATHSILMDFYAEEAQGYLDRYDATAEDFARVAVKNRTHGSHNPLAQYGVPQTVEEVLGSRVIVPPLTLRRRSGRGPRLRDGRRRRCGKRPGGRCRRGCVPHRGRLDRGRRHDRAARRRRPGGADPVLRNRALRRGRRAQVGA